MQQYPTLLFFNENLKGCIMARCFKQLSFQDRLIIDELLNQKKSRSEIAKLIGVHRSTITRELNRNW